MRQESPLDALTNAAECMHVHYNFSVQIVKLEWPINTASEKASQTGRITLELTNRTNQNAWISDQSKREIPVTFYPANWVGFAYKFFLWTTLITQNPKVHSSVKEK